MFQTTNLSAINKLSLELIKLGQDNTSTGQQKFKDFLLDAKKQLPKEDGRPEIAALQYIFLTQYLKNKIPLFSGFLTEENARAYEECQQTQAIQNIRSFPKFIFLTVIFYLLVSELSLSFNHECDVYPSPLNTFFALTRNLFIDSTRNMPRSIQSHLPDFKKEFCSLYISVEGDNYINGYVFESDIMVVFYLCVVSKILFGFNPLTHIANLAMSLLNHINDKLNDSDRYKTFFENFFEKSGLATIVEADSEKDQQGAIKLTFKLNNLNFNLLGENLNPEQQITILEHLFDGTLFNMQLNDANELMIIITPRTSFAQDMALALDIFGSENIQSVIQSRSKSIVNILNITEERATPSEPSDNEGVRELTLS